MLKKIRTGSIKEIMWKVDNRKRSDKTTSAA